MNNWMCNIVWVYIVSLVMMSSKMNKKVSGGMSHHQYALHTGVSVPVLNSKKCVGKLRVVGDFSDTLQIGKHVADMSETLPLKFFIPLIMFILII